MVHAEVLLHLLYLVVDLGAAYVSRATDWTFLASLLQQHEHVDHQCLLGMPGGDVQQQCVAEPAAGWSRQLATAVLPQGMVQALLSGAEAGSPAWWLWAWCHSPVDFLVLLAVLLGHAVGMAAPLLPPPPASAAWHENSTGTVVARMAFRLPLLASLWQAYTIHPALLPFGRWAEMFGTLPGRGRRTRSLVVLSILPTVVCPLPWRWQLLACLLDWLLNWHISGVVAYRTTSYFSRTGLPLHHGGASFIGTGGDGGTTASSSSASSGQLPLYPGSNSSPLGIVESFVWLFVLPIATTLLGHALWGWTWPRRFERITGGGAVADMGRSSSPLGEAAGSPQACGKHAGDAKRGSDVPRSRAQGSGGGEAAECSDVNRPALDARGGALPTVSMLPLAAAPRGGARWPGAAGGSPYAASYYGLPGSAGGFRNSGRMSPTGGPSAGDWDMLSPTAGDRDMLAIFSALAATDDEADGRSSRSVSGGRSIISGTRSFGNGRSISGGSFSVPVAPRLPPHRWPQAAQASAGLAAAAPAAAAGSSMYVRERRHRTGSDDGGASVWSLSVKVPLSSGLDYESAAPAVRAGVVDSIMSTSLPSPRQDPAAAGSTASALDVSADAEVPLVKRVLGSATVPGCVHFMAVFQAHASRASGLCPALPPHSAGLGALLVPGRGSAMAALDAAVRQSVAEVLAAVGGASQEVPPAAGVTANHGGDDRDDRRTMDAVLPLTVQLLQLAGVHSSCSGSGVYCTPVALTGQSTHPQLPETSAWTEQELLLVIPSDAVVAPTSAAAADGSEDAPVLRAVVIDESGSVVLDTVMTAGAASHAAAGAAVGSWSSSNTTNSSDATCSSDGADRNCGPAACLWCLRLPGLLVSPAVLWVHLLGHGAATAAAPGRQPSRLLSTLCVPVLPAAAADEVCRLFRAMQREVAETAAAVHGNVPAALTTMEQGSALLGPSSTAHEVTCAVDTLHMRAVCCGRTEAALYEQQLGPFVIDLVLAVTDPSTNTSQAAAAAAASAAHAAAAEATDPTAAAGQAAAASGELCSHGGAECDSSVADTGLSAFLAAQGMHACLQLIRQQRRQAPPRPPHQQQQQQHEKLRERTLVDPTDPACCLTSVHCCSSGSSAATVALGSQRQAPCDALACTTGNVLVVCCADSAVVTPAGNQAGIDSTLRRQQACSALPLHYLSPTAARSADCGTGVVQDNGDPAAGGTCGGIEAAGSGSWAADGSRHKDTSNSDGAFGAASTMAAPSCSITSPPRATLRSVLLGFPQHAMEARYIVFRARQQRVVVQIGVALELLLLAAAQLAAAGRAAAVFKSYALLFCSPLGTALQAAALNLRGPSVGRWWELLLAASSVCLLAVVPLPWVVSGVPATGILRRAISSSTGVSLLCFVTYIALPFFLSVRPKVQVVLTVMTAPCQVALMRVLAGWRGATLWLHGTAYVCTQLAVAVWLDIWCRQRLLALLQQQQRQQPTAAAAPAGRNAFAATHEQ